MMDFNNLFEELKGLNNAELVNACNEAQQEKKRNFLIIAIIFCFIVVVEIVLLQDMVKAMMSLISSLQISIFAFIFTLIFGSKKQKAYKKLYKTIMIRRLIGNFYDNVKYFPNEILPRDIYDDGEYEEYYNRYFADDYISAEIDYTYSIQLANLDVKRRTGSGKHQHTVTIFSGLFAKINLDKSIYSKILIKLNGSDSSMERVRMDSSEFENHFDVYSLDSIKALQILTHDVMEELIRFKSISGINFDVSIVNHNLYIRFFTGSLFETVPENMENLDETSLKKYYDILDFTKTLSKMLIKTISETKI